MLSSCCESRHHEDAFCQHEPVYCDRRSWKSIDWIERNEAHDTIAMVSGACLANEPTWPLPAFLLAGCRAGGDVHWWDSGTGDVCC
jgi:hypothetical protein